MRLENGRLLAEINPVGGALSRIYDKKTGKEILYRIQKDSWQATDHILFPMVGRTMGETYTHKGVTYNMCIHGFLKSMRGIEVRISLTEGEIRFRDDKDSYELYPFHWSLTAHYSLKNNSLIVTYIVQNDEKEETMPFGLGGHPGFRIPTTLDELGRKDGEGNFLVFEKELQLTYVPLKEAAYPFDARYGLMDGQMLDLNNILFDRYGTVILDAKDISRFILKKRDGSRIALAIGDCPYLAIWRDLNGDFVALEPWLSLPDMQPLEMELSKKKSLLSLPPKERFLYSYQISVA